MHLSAQNMRQEKREKDMRRTNSFQSEFVNSLKEQIFHDICHKNFTSQWHKLSKFYVFSPAVLKVNKFILSLICKCENGFLRAISHWRWGLRCEIRWEVHFKHINDSMYIKDLERWHHYNVTSENCKIMLISR